MADERTRRCPCGSGESYPDCCGRLHAGSRHAATATELMRSRYAAFAVGDLDYLRNTWDGATRPAELDADDVRWQYLEIVTATRGGPFDNAGTVEFRAHYRRRGRGPGDSGVLHEVSRFRRVGGRWFYVGPTP